MRLVCKHETLKSFLVSKAICKMSSKQDSPSIPKVTFAVQSATTVSISVCYQSCGRGLDDETARLPAGLGVLGVLLVKVEVTSGGES